MNPDIFDYNLDDKVRIGKRVAGDEKGIVIARVEYSGSPPMYYVAYVDGTGSYRKDWFYAEDLSDDMSV